MLLTNGRIYTLDAAGTIVDTLVVRDGRVAYAGRRADVNPSPGEEVVDLGGRAALPGLVDAHGHLMHLARVRLTLDLRGTDSEEAAARRVAGRALSVEGHARSGRAGSCGRARAHRRACDLGELRRAARRRHRPRH